ncbi:uncharacterized protein PHACADRAFT_195958 [Phanerochaete carnosa HHB-10118-sp]|uniref:Uncharacterized protein n=1 Tax=Phanerochaete carnosa (strain HHB-10118-sp) TaxID=650164 RepID=K5WAB5_PHACS|nr:uncharacterized protein PHACADRAFT_195958 [Phanerochaete carnosa HHB-10118-sp]EKM55904.1 hypothetical protein PHACADRAFT_195958 [Phanerochaete carnosa HHB-10118-sp]
MSSTLATIFERVPISTLTVSTLQICIQSSSSPLPDIQYTYNADVSEGKFYHTPEIAQSQEIKQKYRETTYLQRITEIHNNYSAVELLTQLAEEQDNAIKIFARTVTSFHALNEHFTDTHRNAADLVHINN